MIQPTHPALPEVLAPSDIKRLEQAFRNQWEMPETIWRAVPQIMAKIIGTGTPRERVAAARVLVAMQSQNNPPQPKMSFVAHQHKHEAPQPVNASNMDERRRQLRSRIDRLR